MLDGGLNVQENQYKRTGEIATLASILAGRNVLSPDECAWIENALTREAASASAAGADRVSTPRASTTARRTPESSSAEAAPVVSPSPSPAAPGVATGPVATHDAAPPSRLETTGSATRARVPRKRVAPEDDLAGSTTTDDAPASRPSAVRPASKPHPARVSIVTADDLAQVSLGAPPDPVPPSRAAGESTGDVVVVAAPLASRSTTDVVDDLPPLRLEAARATAHVPTGRKRVPSEDDLASSAASDEPPPSRLARPDAVPASGVGAAPVRPRRPFRLASLLPYALVAGGIGLCFGLYAGLAWLDRSGDDGDYQRALSLARAEEKQAAIDALLAYLKARPAGLHRAEATLAAQELVLNRAQVHARLGLVDSAIADYRLVRELDPDAELAHAAQAELGVLAAAQEQAERDRRWRTYATRIEGLLAAGKLREATDALRELPFDPLSEAEAATRDALAERARAALETHELARFRFIASDGLGLPAAPPPPAPPPGPDALARYRVGECPPLDPPAAGPDGVVPIALGTAVLGIDARTAAPRWRRELPPGTRCLSPVAIRDDAAAGAGAGVLPRSALLVDNARRCVERIDLATGDPAWTRALGTQITAAPLVLAPHAYVGASDGRLYRLALATGECTGAYVTGGEIVAPPTYDATSDLLLIPAADGFAYAYAVETGAFLGRLSAPPHLGVPPILCGDVVLVPHPANDRTELVAHRLAAVSGKPLVATALARFSIDGTIRTPALVRGGRIALATDRDVLLVLAIDGDEVQPVYALTRESGGRRVSLSGPIHLLERAFGQELVLAADDLQLFALPKPGASDATAFGVDLVWRHEDPRKVDAPILGVAAMAPVHQGEWLLVATREPESLGLHLQAFDLAARASLWQRTLESGAVGAEAFVTDPGPRDGRLVLATEDGALHGVSFDGGPPIYRKLRAGGAQLSSAGIAVAGEALLLGRGRDLVKVDLVTGERDPAFTLDFAFKGDVCAGPVVDGALAYVASANGAVYAIDAATGKAAMDHFTMPTGKAAATDPLPTAGVVVVGAHDHCLYALEPGEATGRKYLRARWTIKTGGDVRVRPVAIGDRIWAGSDDGKLRAIVPADGRVVVEIQLPAAIDGPLVLVGPSLLLVPTADRRVVAVSLDTHAIVWSQAINGLVRTAPIMVDGKIWIATTAGKVMRLDRDTGAVEWTHALADRFLGGAIHRAGSALYAVGRSGYLYEVPLPR